MLNDGRQTFLTHPHIMIFPGLAIALTVLSVNLFGDGLRDAMDVRLGG
jgi:peptide/nickel transport system permease protein